MRNNLPMPLPDFKGHIENVVMSPKASGAGILWYTPPALNMNLEKNPSTHYQGESHHEYGVLPLETWESGPQRQDGSANLSAGQV